MTLDEAILHCEEVAEKNEKDARERFNILPLAGQQRYCLKCADEHRQLAYWLKSYKELLDQRGNADLIDRRKAIHQIAEGIDDKAYFGTVEKDWEVIDFLKSQDRVQGTALPAKTGHWITIDDCELFVAKCSECGKIVDSRMINKYQYCCRCGARMAESEK